MNEPQQSPSPKGILGLLNQAMLAYVARLPLYLGLAALGFIAQSLGLVLTLAADTTGNTLFGASTQTRIISGSLLILVVNVVVDAYLTAAIARGTLDTIEGTTRTRSALIGAATVRWGIVALVAAVATIVGLCSQRLLLGDPVESLYGLLILPTLVVWAALALAQVAAAVAPPAAGNRAATLAALGGFFIALRGRNLTRSLAIGTLMLPQLIAQIVAGAALQPMIQAPHMPYGAIVLDFLANVPIDAIAIGPFTAIVTTLLIDLRRRTTA